MAVVEVIGDHVADHVTPRGAPKATPCNARSHVGREGDAHAVHAPCSPRNGALGIAGGADAVGVAVTGGVKPSRRAPARRDDWRPAALRARRTGHRDQHQTHRQCQCRDARSVEPLCRQIVYTIVERPGIGCLGFWRFGDARHLGRLVVHDDHRMTTVPAGSQPGSSGSFFMVRDFFPFAWFAGVSGWPSVSQILSPPSWCDRLATSRRVARAGAADSHCSSCSAATGQAAAGTESIASACPQPPSVRLSLQPGPGTIRSTASLATPRAMFVAKTPLSIFSIRRL